MTSQLKRSLGLKVQAARHRTGLTQEELASRISRTAESVSNIERGLHLPTLETLIDLGRALGVPIAEFFDEAEGTPLISRERRVLEATLREVGRLLSDRDLAVAVAQAKVFLEQK